MNELIKIIKNEFESIRNINLNDYESMLALDN